MTKTELRAMFLRALNIAADNTEAKLVEPVPRSFQIESHGAGCPGRIVNVDEAVNHMFLGEDRFYLLIDVPVREILPGATVVFTRVSDHPPAGFERTFDPSGLGPFKQIFSEHVADRRVHDG